MSNEFAESDQVDLTSPWLEPHQVAVDPGERPGWHDDIVRTAAVTGAAPFTLVRSFSTRESFEAEDHLPEGCSVAASSTSDGSRLFLVTAPDLVLTLRATRDDLYLYGAATTAERRDGVDEYFSERFPREVPDPDLVALQFAFADHGIARVHRALRVRQWDDVRQHYSTRAAELFDQLVTMPRDPQGRILLFHGPPGTGKTSALLTLAGEWRDWCRFVFVLDPEELFSGSPGYVMELALGGRAEKWQMLVIEDAGDLLRPTAKDGMHPGLARLLNLTDGALGQGLRVLVCISTNEPLSSIHSALQRPGRCLANIHFPALAADEANALLPDGVRASAPMTLAEVLERRGDLRVLSAPDEPVRAGAYL